MLPADPEVGNPVMIALGLVFGRLGLAEPGVVSSRGAGGGIRGKGRTELPTSFEVASVDVPATSG